MRSKLTTETKSVPPKFCGLQDDGQRQIARNFSQVLDNRALLPFTLGDLRRLKDDFDSYRRAAGLASVQFGWADLANVMRCKASVMAETIRRIESALVVRNG